MFVFYNTRITLTIPLQYSYLKVIDKYNEWLISAYITATGDRLLILHDVKNDEPIRVFFLEVYELYLKFLLNPFYERGQAIDSAAFDGKVRGIARKYLKI